MSIRLTVYSQRRHLSNASVIIAKKLVCHSFHGCRLQSCAAFVRRLHMRLVFMMRFVVLQAIRIGQLTDQDMSKRWNCINERMKGVEVMPWPPVA